MSKLKQQRMYENLTQPHEASYSKLPSPIQQQASKLLNDAGSKKVFDAGKAENGSEGLPKAATSADDKSAKEISNSTNKDAIKGMNADSDKVKSMMENHGTPELFQELKEQDKEAAIEFALRNPEYQRQALHETGDKAFAETMRKKLTGKEQA